jgi:hypothetical protein
MVKYKIHEVGKNISNYLEPGQGQGLQCMCKKAQETIYNLKLILLFRKCKNLHQCLLCIYMYNICFLFQYITETYLGSCMGHRNASS